MRGKEKTEVSTHHAAGVPEAGAGRRIRATPTLSASAGLRAPTCRQSSEALSLPPAPTRPRVSVRCLHRPPPSQYFGLSDSPSTLFSRHTPDLTFLLLDWWVLEGPDHTHQ